MGLPIDRLIDEAFSEYDDKLREAAKHRREGRFLDAVIAYENAAEFAMNNVDEFHCRRRADECAAEAEKQLEGVAA